MTLRFDNPGSQITVGSTLLLGPTELTGLPNIPGGDSSSTSKFYVDSLVASGISWRRPIQEPDVVGIAVAEPGSPTTDTTYIAFGGGSYPQTWTGALSVNSGDVVTWNGSIWIFLFNLFDIPPSNQFWRIGIAMEHGTPDTTLTNAPLSFRKNDIVQWVPASTDPTQSASWTFPEGRANDGGGGPYISQGATLLVDNPNSLHFGHTYLYDNTGNQWIEINASGASAALSGLTAAVAPNTISSGDNAQTWNWQLTSATTAGLKISENAPSSGGINQYLLQIDNLSGSTANPLLVSVSSQEVINVSPTGGLDLFSQFGQPLNIVAQPFAGFPGQITITSGSGLFGGSVGISGGNGSVGDGGSIVATPGTGASGVDGSVYLGRGTTSTTRTGDMLYIPTSAGVPTGVPSPAVGLVPVVLDTTDNAIYFYSTGTWHAISAVSAPANEVLYGTGTGFTSSSNFTFNGAEIVLGVGSNLQLTLTGQVATGSQDLQLIGGSPVATGRNYINLSNAGVGIDLFGWIGTAGVPNGGYINLTAGTGYSVTGGDGGAIAIAAGNGAPIDGTTTANGGTVDITGGAASGHPPVGTIVAGDINITGGALTNNVTSGVKASTETAGNVNITGGALSGTGNKNNPGSVTLTGGQNNQTDGTGGDVILLGGFAPNGNSSGGSVDINASSAGFGGSGNGGNFIAYAGDATTGVGGSADIRGGETTTGAAGGVQLVGARATGVAGVAGDIKLFGGISTIATATPGEIFMGSNGSKVTHSGGDFSNNPIYLTDDKDAITRQYVSRIITTTNTATEMFLDGSAGFNRRMVLANNSAWRFEIHLAAYETVGANVGWVAAYEIKGAIKQVAGTTSIVGAVSVNTTADDSGGTWSVAVTADNTNHALVINVTGQAATTIRWVAFVRTVEVKA